MCSRCIQRGFPDFMARRARLAPLGEGVLIEASSSWRFTYHFCSCNNTKGSNHSGQVSLIVVGGSLFLSKPSAYWGSPRACEVSHCGSDGRGASEHLRQALRRRGRVMILALLERFVARAARSCPSVRRTLRLRAGLFSINDRAAPSPLAAQLQLAHTALLSTLRQLND